MSPFRIALFVSLGLNLFVVGWWVGDISRRPPPMQPQPLTMANMVKDRLSDETMEAIRPSLDALDAVIRDGFVNRTELFAKLREAVAADPYDQALVEDLLGQLVSQRTTAETEQWQIIGEALAHLTTEQRGALADIVFVRPNPMPPPSGPNGPRPMPMGNPPSPPSQ